MAASARFYAYILDKARKSMTEANYETAFSHYLLAIKINQGRLNKIYYEFVLCMNHWTNLLNCMGKDDQLTVAFMKAKAVCSSSQTLMCALAEQALRLEKFSTAVHLLKDAGQLYPQSLSVQETWERVSYRTVERWHFKMLNDVNRNKAYHEAIVQTIKENKVSSVLDIGCGTGLLSLFADHGGANCITLCDACPVMTDIASSVVRDHRHQSHSASKFRIFHAQSTNLQVPKHLSQRVDLVVTEIFDAALFGEHCLSTLLHAWTHLLNNSAEKHGEVLPRTAQLYMCAIECQEIRKENSVQAASVPVLHLNDFNILSRTGAVGEEPYTTEDLNSIRGSYKFLSPLLPFVTVDFNNPNALKHLSDYATTVQLDIYTEGTVDALAVWFELDLGLGKVVSTAPDSTCCWEQAIFPIFSQSSRNTKSGAATVCHLLPKVNCGDQLEVNCELNGECLHLSLDKIVPLGYFLNTSHIPAQQSAIGGQSGHCVEQVVARHEPADLSGHCMEHVVARHEPAELSGHCMEHIVARHEPAELSGHCVKQVVARHESAELSGHCVEHVVARHKPAEEGHEKKLGQENSVPHSGTNRGKSVSEDLQSATRQEGVLREASEDHLCHYPTVEKNQEFTAATLDHLITPNQARDREKAAAEDKRQLQKGSDPVTDQDVTGNCPSLHVIETIDISEELLTPLRELSYDCKSCLQNEKQAINSSVCATPTGHFRMNRKTAKLYGYKKNCTYVSNTFHFHREEIRHLNDNKYNSLCLSALQHILNYMKSAKRVINISSGLPVVGLMALKLGFQIADLYYVGPGRKEEVENFTEMIWQHNRLQGTQWNWWEGPLMEVVHTFAGSARLDCVWMDVVDMTGALRQGFVQELQALRPVLSRDFLVIPQAVDVYAILIDSPQLLNMSCVVSDENTQGCRIAPNINPFRTYTFLDLDFHTLSHQNLSDVTHVFHMDFQSYMTSPSPSLSRQQPTDTVTTPVNITKKCKGLHSEFSQSKQLRLVARHSGNATAIVFWFDLTLAPGLNVSTVDPEMNWKQAAYLLYGGKVEKGQEVQVEARLEKSFLHFSLDLPKNLTI